MATDDWQKIEAAFEAALSLEGDARAAFVDAFERSEPDLGQQLRKLLAADEGGDADLRGKIESAAESLTSAGGDPWIGREIGAWTITRRLAGGGMSAVFLAERSDQQYSQTVAVKVMAAQLLMPEAISRFKSERQILANLNHPYIAKLIDGGSTDDGLPFLVMEYVQGLPIDQHCDEQKLTIDQRLGLFRNVCNAVDYAHRNLIVHRDLKPSNILVDGNGDPKLLDFGIAKLLDAGAYNNTIAMTREGSRAMTPEYASPEQVRGEPISVSTDVYALGVLLFRLMTGQSPYGATLSTAREYERAIVETDPRRPSTVITAPDADVEIVERRDTSAERLRRRLVGDLDNIVLKTLQKEQERRYPTASALSADIRRFLAHEPVEARGDDWIYKSTKFAVRNARGLLIAAIVLIGGASLVTYYTLRIADERDRANLAAAESREVSSFLSGLFASASPFASQGETITAIDLLDQGREQIDQLDDQPLLQAELYRIMGSSYTALGETDTSVPLLEKALAAKRPARPRDELSIAETLENLSEAHRQHGESEVAEEYLRRALAIREAELGPNNNVVADTKGRLGVVLFDRRKREEGLQILQEALATKNALGSGEDSAAIDMHGNIANSLDSLGRYEEAISLHQETIALSKRVDGELHPNTIIRMSNLGLTMMRQGEVEDAVDQFSEAILLGQQVWPPNHDQLAFMTGAKAAGLKRLGRLEDSLQQYNAAAEMTRQGIGEDNTRFVARLRGVGSILMDMRQFDEADVTFNRALALAIELEGDDGYHATVLRVFLGQSKVDQMQYAAAESYLRDAIKSSGKLGRASALIAKNELAIAISAQGRYDEAQPLFLEALAEKESTNGPTSPALLGFLSETGAHYRRAGDLTKALEYGERAYPIAHAKAAEGSLTAAQAIADYARTLGELGRSDDAQKYYREAHGYLLAAYGPDDDLVADLAKTLQQ